MEYLINFLLFSPLLCPPSTLIIKVDKWEAVLLAKKVKQSILVWYNKKGRAMWRKGRQNENKMAQLWNVSGASTSRISFSGIKNYPNSIFSCGCFSKVRATLGLLEKMRVKGKEWPSLLKKRPSGLWQLRGQPPPFQAWRTCFMLKTLYFTFQIRLKWQSRLYHNKIISLISHRSCILV